MGGKFTVIEENIQPGQLTISAVPNDNYIIIKMYIGNTYVPFSRSKYLDRGSTFLADLGFDRDVCLDEIISDDLMSYGSINDDGSVSIQQQCFKEEKIQISENVVEIPSSYGINPTIIHEDFEPINSTPNNPTPNNATPTNSASIDSASTNSTSTTSNNENNKKNFLIIGIVIGAILLIFIIIIIIIIIILIVIIKKKKAQQILSSNEANP